MYKLLSFLYPPKNHAGISHGSKMTLNVFICFLKCFVALDQNIVSYNISSYSEDIRNALSFVHGCYRHYLNICPCRLQVKNLLL